MCFMQPASRLAGGLRSLGYGPTVQDQIGDVGFHDVFRRVSNPAWAKVYDLSRDLLRSLSIHVLVQ